MFRKTYTIDDLSLTPRQGKLKSRGEAITHPFIYSAPMDTVSGYYLVKEMLAAGQCAVLSRFITRKEWVKAVTEFHAHENFFIALGLKDDYSLFFEALVALFDVGTKLKVNLALDVAHGDTEFAHDATYRLSNNSMVNHIMSGSICTGEGAIRAVGGACTHLRVGVGPGAACSTRLMTGVGVPNANAVLEIRQELNDYGIHNVELIADGGIRYPGDAVKYLALGANAVMLGSVLSRTFEAPGWTCNEEGKLVKIYRGQASKEFQSEVLGHVNACPEGVSHREILWEGNTVSKTVSLFEEGLRSALSYLGISNSLELLNNEDIKIISVSESGQREGQPHGLTTNYQL